MAAAVLASCGKRPARRTGVLDGSPGLVAQLEPDVRRSAGNGLKQILGTDRGQFRHPVIICGLRLQDERYLGVQAARQHDGQQGWSLLCNGTSYASWAAGYATTSSISLGTFSYFGSDQVAVGLAALQDDGNVYTYQGTYAVQDGLIVSANIVQTG